MNSPDVRSGVTLTSIAAELLPAMDQNSLRILFEGA